jgi:hypothetical protein
MLLHFWQELDGLLRPFCRIGEAVFIRNHFVLQWVRLHLLARFKARRFLALVFELLQSLNSNALSKPFSPDRLDFGRWIHG